MGYLYFPREEHLRPLSPSELLAIELAAEIVAGKTPHKFESPLAGFRFFVDQGMTEDTGILGYTEFLNNKILLSPAIVMGIAWKDRNGVYNNEAAMGTVIHELTHRRQMKWLYGAAWLFLNIPGIDMTIERMARKNGEAATEILEKHYAEKRKLAGKS